MRVRSLGSRSSGRFVIDALLILLVYAAMILLVSPRHEFPLNDDWAHARSVLHLLKTGELQISDWTSATLIFQVYWGAWFTGLAGDFSFTTLRVSTLITSIIGALGMYTLLRQFGIYPGDCLIGCLTLVVNPLYSYLSYTFLSDVFFVSLLLISANAYVWGLKAKDNRFLFLGSLFAAFSFLIRQLGAFTVFAVVVVLIAYEWPPKSARLSAAAAVPLLTVIGHTLWLQHSHGVPWATRIATQLTIHALQKPGALALIASKGLLSLTYLGLFALPLLMGLAITSIGQPLRLLAKHNLIGEAGSIVVGTVSAMAVMKINRAMPYLRNVINREGLGPIGLIGNKIPVTPDWVFVMCGILAIPAAAALGWLGIKAITARPRLLANPAMAFLVLANILIAAASLVFWNFFDRYLIVFVPLAILLVLQARPLSALGRAASVLVCIAVATYSLAELSDYLAWNEARWSAGRALVAKGVQPEDIDGGFEWIGWYEFEYAPPPPADVPPDFDPLYWMKLHPRKYLFSFSPLEGYTVVSAVPYGNRGGQIYVLAKPDSLPPEP